MYTKVEDENEPEWVQSERDSFKDERDKVMYVYILINIILNKRKDTTLI